MRAILMSVKQKHLAKILNGEKTVEIRKSFPEDFVGFVYLYCDKDKLHSDNNLLTKRVPSFTGEEDLNGKVVARFWLEKSEKLLCHKFSDNKISYGLEETIEGNFGLERMTGLSIIEIHKYLKGENGRALHINNLEIFDEPKELKEFRVFDKSYANSFCWDFDGWMYIKAVEKTRIKIETYDYGVKYATGYKDITHFENNVYFVEGYVLTEDGMIINAKEIKCAYEVIE